MLAADTQAAERTDLAGSTAAADKRAADTAAERVGIQAAGIPPVDIAAADRPAEGIPQVDTAVETLAALVDRAVAGNPEDSPARPLDSHSPGVDWRPECRRTAEQQVVPHRLDSQVVADRAGPMAAQVGRVRSRLEASSLNLLRA